jgi:DNA-binding response OmpR family regulator
MIALVVESSSDIRNSLCYILLSLGIKGIPCATREEAVGAAGAASENIFCAVIDIDNKALGGPGLIQELKRIPAAANIKIIVHTIQSNREAVLKMLNLGIIGYLLKPYRESETPAKLGKILQRIEGQEKRSHIRVTPDPQDLLRVHFRVPGYPHLVSGKITNLSMGGLAMELYSPVNPPALDKDTHISSMQFTLLSKELSPSGTVMVRNNKYLAIGFSAINQKDSIVLAKYIYKKMQV